MLVYGTLICLGQPCCSNDERGALTVSSVRNMYFSEDHNPPGVKCYPVNQDPVTYKMSQRLRRILASQQGMTDAA